MKEYMFVNANDSNLFRYFRLGDNWQQCYVIQFRGESDSFDQVYWGNYSYVEPDRRIISELLTMSFLPDASDGWKQVDYDFVYNNIRFEKIIELVGKEIKKVEVK